MDAFFLLRNKLESYWERHGLPESSLDELAGAISTFLDWIINGSPDATADHRRELSQLTPLELVCLHATIQWETPAGREKDLGRMYSKLAAIFEEERETALAMLSGNFAVREEMYEARGRKDRKMNKECEEKLKSFYQRSMDVRFAAEVGELDSAFLRAFLCSEYNYTISIYTVESDKIMRGQTERDNFIKLSMAASDSNMMKYFSFKCALDTLHFDSIPFRRANRRNDSASERESFILRWKEFLRQVASDFGRHKFFIKAVGRFGDSGVPSLEDCLEVYENALRILRNHDDDDDEDDNDADGVIKSLQEAKLLYRIGVVLLKLERSEEGNKSLAEALVITEGRAENQSSKIRLVQENYARGPADIGRVERLPCHYGSSCWNLPLGKCDFFHPRSDLNRGH